MSLSYYLKRFREILYQSCINFRYCVQTNHIKFCLNCDLCSRSQVHQIYPMYKVYRKCKPSTFNVSPVIYGPMYTPNIVHEVNALYTTCTGFMPYVLRWHPISPTTIIPTAHYFDSPLLRQPIIPTTHYSDSPLFRQCVFLMCIGKFSLKRPTPFFMICVVVRLDYNYFFHAGYLSQYIGVNTNANGNCSVFTHVPYSF
jgi:hypothetical protein